MSIIKEVYLTIILPRKLFIFFLLSGGVAAIMNMISRYVLFKFLDYRLSVAIAYIVGMAVAFVLFKFTVFKVKEKDSLTREIVSFVLVNILGLIQAVIVSVLLAEHLFPRIGFTFRPYDVAHFIGIMVPVGTSYFLHKHITFGKRIT